MAGARLQARDPVRVGRKGTPSHPSCAPNTRHAPCNRLQRARERTAPLTMHVVAARPVSKTAAFSRIDLSVVDS